jgi:hypothetical protein
MRLPIIFPQLSFFIRPQLKYYIQVLENHQKVTEKSQITWNKWGRIGRPLGVATPDRCASTSLFVFWVIMDLWKRALKVGFLSFGCLIDLGLVFGVFFKGKVFEFWDVNIVGTGMGDQIFEKNTFFVGL